MFRTSGFPEYSPRQQKIYDQILSIIAKSFASYNYDHIWTPAVEKNTILVKGGGEAQNQIFGLHGLKQGIEDIKDYSLHFDLTIPFARYTLDHLHEIALPFRRYQMQPVWRGERAQKGRFKEFWQCDIDSIWRSESDIGVWYDIETILVLQKTLNIIFDYFGLQTDFVTKLNHIGLTKLRLAKIGIADISSLCALLDDYYKIDRQNFMTKLSGLADKTQQNQIIDLLDNKDITVFQGLEGYEDLIEVLQTLHKLGCQVVYDFAIVRGLGYYTGTVFETFCSDGGGSICSGGAYRNFTDFIDPKISLSGVGGSIGISRVMDYVIEKVDIQTQPDTYLIINFDETRADLPILQDHLIQAGKIVELYPNTHKLKKQFEYADRKGITYCVIYGVGEKEKNNCIIKHMSTGDQVEYIFEYGAGIIPVYQDGDTYKVLLVWMTAGQYRSFPKGHLNPGETHIGCAKRETKEEIGLQFEDIDENVTLKEYVLAQSNKRNFLKEVTYFVGFCKDIADDISTQKGEIQGAIRCTLEQAEERATYHTTKEIIKALKKTLHT